MSQLEKVSIILPVYNSELTLEYTLETIFRQDYKSFVLYAVNDGSVDSSLDILNKYKSKFPQQMQVINQANQGQTVAKNNAIKVAQGQYIALIDSDDLWALNKLSKQVNLMDNDLEVGLCYTDGYYIDEKGINTGEIGTDPTLQGDCLKRFLLGNAIVASSVMIRRSVLDKVGVFDAQLRACENWELWTRVSSVSKIATINEPLICYRRHANNLSHNITNMQENRLKVIRENFIRYKNLLPDIKQVTKQAYYTAYKFFGEDYLFKLKIKQAQKNLIRALYYNPTDIKLYKLLFKSLLGKNILILARRFRHQLATK